MDIMIWGENKSDDWSVFGRKFLNFDKKRMKINMLGKTLL